MKSFHNVELKAFCGLCWPSGGKLSKLQIVEVNRGCQQVPKEPEFPDFNWRNFPNFLISL